MTTSKEHIQSTAKSTSKPSFSLFVKNNLRFIEEKSVKWNEATPLKLMNRWRHTYNRTMIRERPGVNIIKRFKKANEEFERIFAAANSIQNLQLHLRSRTAEPSTGTSNDGDVSEIDSFISDTSSLSSTEESSNSDSDSDSDSADTIINSEMSKVSKEELFKLNKSKCINLLMNNYRDYYKSNLPADLYFSMIERCMELKISHEALLKVSAKEAIDTVFEELNVFRFDKSNDKIIKYVDNKKSSITDKHSEEYKLFSIVELIVKSFKTYKKEDKLSENTYLHKFEMIVEILFEDSGLCIKDGESSCLSTQKMQIMNHSETDYGRRIDLLVTTDADDNETEHELCSVEFKKHNVDNSTMIKQQSKNARINCCILNEMHLLANNTDATITYMDFSGRSGYIAQLFKHNNNYIVHKTGNVLIPKSLVELNLLKSTMHSLFLWMESLVQNRNLAATAYANEQARYNLLDVATSCVPSGSQTPPRRQVEPERIFLSPSNRTKRTRPIFEDESPY